MLGAPSRGWGRPRAQTGLGPGKPCTAQDIKEGVKKLRRLILVEGVRSDEDPTLRPRIWKILLGVDDLAADKYLAFVAREPSDFRHKIRNDTFSAVATDRGVKERARVDMLVRLLDAFGLNVLAAPFLYTMPSDVEAFFAFSRFSVLPALRAVDARRYLTAASRSSTRICSRTCAARSCPPRSIYAFPSVLALCACTPPLDQVLRFRDFLLAYGMHLKVLCVIAQRMSWTTRPSPMRLLSTLPPLEALPIINIAVTLVRDLPAEKLVRHVFEPVNTGR
ncbi:hypothetical protein AURDEDRAFT_139184 [Auricularia subglabra TFB-10046 SS5]|nr:hypothetical protein AURDEDRAFT_139184 [Auricularia subglabra TFB-10046 SS5]